MEGTGTFTAGGRAIIPEPTMLLNRMEKVLTLLFLSDGQLVGARQDDGSTERVAHYP